MRKFTAQEVVNMGAALYDNHGFTRSDIYAFLTVLVDQNLADIDLPRIFDMIVG